MEEVDDEVFYSSRSLVFPEAENRKWTVMVGFMFIECIVLNLSGFNLIPTTAFSLSGSDGLSSDWLLATDPHAQVLISGLQVEFYLPVMVNYNFWYD